MGVIGHWTNPRAFLDKYVTEIDRDALDTFNLWYQTMLRQSYRDKYGSGRELTNGLSEIIDIYQFTWDPLLVGYLRPMGDSALGLPFKDYRLSLNFAFFNRTWPIRYDAFARDPRVVENLKEALANDTGYPALLAYVADRTGNPDDLERIIPGFYSAVHQVYSNPGDPLDGYSFYASAVSSRFLEEIPYILRAMADAGLEKLPQGNAVENQISHYPTGSKLTVLALDADDKPFVISLKSAGGMNMAQATLKVFSPGGKEILSEKLHSKEEGVLRYIGGKIRHIAVPADGEKGVYRIELRGHRPVYHAPLTDLPHEIASYTGGDMGTARGRTRGWIFVPDAPEFTLEIQGFRFPYKIAYPAYVRVSSTDGAILKETSLLPYSNRERESITVAGDAKGVRCQLFTASREGPILKWQPAEATLYFSVREESFEPVLQALKTTPPVTASK